MHDPGDHGPGTEVYERGLTHILSGAYGPERAGFLSAFLTEEAAVLRKRADRLTRLIKQNRPPKELPIPWLRKHQAPAPSEGPR